VLGKETKKNAHVRSKLEKEKHKMDTAIFDVI
jgi:hypothetical protein